MSALVLGLAIAAGAAVSNQPASQHPGGTPGNVATAAIRQSVVTTEIPAGFRPANRTARASAFEVESPRPVTFRPRHVKSQTLRAAVAGAAVGLFAGAAMGYVVTNKSYCDTCGLAGLVYGAPIGGVLGGIIAVKWR